VGARLIEAHLEIRGAAVPATWAGGDLYQALVPSSGSTITFRACATDQAGNQGCSEEITANVPEDPVIDSAGACSLSHPRKSDEPLVLFGVGLLGLALWAARRRAVRKASGSTSGLS
jgi:hypothetical protein